MTGPDVQSAGFVNVTAKVSSVRVVVSLANPRAARLIGEVAVRSYQVSSSPVVNFTYHVIVVAQPDELFENTGVFVTFVAVDST